MAQTVSAEKLVETGAHFGHQMRRSYPKMKEFMYKEQDDTFIFDLIKTKEYIETALNLIEETANAGKTILIVGTKRQFKDKVIEVAKETGSFYVSERWLGGTFTNFDQLKKSLSKLEKMEEMLKNGEYKNYTKKEKLLVSRDIEKMNRMIGGLRGIAKIPDLMFVIDTHKEDTAVREGRRLNVPVIGIVDSNGDPADVDFPIPMNDDATLAVSYVLDLVKDTILNAKPKAATKTKTSTSKEKTAKVKKETKKK